MLVLVLLILWRLNDEEEKEELAFEFVEMLSKEVIAKSEELLLLLLVLLPLLLSLLLLLLLLLSLRLCVLWRSNCCDDISSSSSSFEFEIPLPSPLALAVTFMDGGEENWGTRILEPETVAAVVGSVPLGPELIEFK